jgi:quinol monooxygenase YgiN
MHPQLTIIAEFTPKHEATATLRNILADLIAPTRSETGCLAYHLHEYEAEGTHFVFYETWKTKEDFEKHMQTAYISALIWREAELLEKPVEVKIIDMISDFPSGSA